MTTVLRRDLFGFPPSPTLFCFSSETDTWEPLLQSQVRTIRKKKRNSLQVINADLPPALIRFPPANMRVLSGTFLIRFLETKVDAGFWRG